MENNKKSVDVVLPPQIEDGNGKKLEKSCLYIGYDVENKKVCF